MNDPLLVVIVTHNSARFLPGCLAALPAALRPQPEAPPLPHRVVVVDNASRDATVAWARGRPEITLICHRTNAGYARGVNAAAQRFPGHVLMLNPDTVPQPGSLARLYRTLREHPDAGAVGPALLTPTGEVDPRGARAWPSVWSEVWDKLGGPWRWPDHPWSRRCYLGRWLAQRTSPSAVPALSGAALLVRREAWDAVRGMDTRFWLYHEDTDLCYRLWQAGWTCLYDPRARVVHYGGGSSPAPRLHLGLTALTSTETYFRLHRGARVAWMYRLLMGALAVGKMPYWLARGRWDHVRVQVAVLQWAWGKRR